MISSWFHEHDNEFTVHLWDVVDWEILILYLQLTNVQHLFDTVMLIWTKIFVEWFQQLVGSLPQTMKAVLKAKEIQPGINKMYLIKCSVTVDGSHSWSKNSVSMFLYILYVCLTSVLFLPLNSYNLLTKLFLIFERWMNTFPRISGWVRL